MSSPEYRKSEEGRKKEAARSKVAAAIKRGDLVRPSACELCGDEPAPAKDGRSQIQGHHHNGYDRPLDVQWICVKCHRLETPVPAGDKLWACGETAWRIYGSLNGNAKLSEADIPAILARISRGERIGLISAEYGVSGNVISAIKHNKAWKHVPRALSPGGADE